MSWYEQSEELGFMYAAIRGSGVKADDFVLRKQATAEAYYCMWKECQGVRKRPTEVLNAKRLTDLDHFEAVLPDNLKTSGHVDGKTRETLLRHFTAQLANVSTEQDAITVLEMAANLIHSATRREFEETADLLLDGIFNVGNDSTRGRIVRAFDAKTLAPCIIKFSSAAAVVREAEMYQMLSGSGFNYVSNEIVTVERRHARVGETIDKSVALKMPIFVSSLAAVPRRVRENVAHTRVMNYIFPALTHMHALGIFHMDVKLENILLDANGRWYLADFGSCASKATDKYDITPSKKPHDLPHRPPTARYDKILLAVVCMDLTVGFLATHPGFSLAELRQAVEGELKDKDFQAFVMSLTV